MVPDSSSSAPKPERRGELLLPIGLLLIALAMGAVAWLSSPRQELLPFLAATLAATLLLHLLHRLLARRGIEPRWRMLVGGALALRLLMLPMLPSLSDDAWRYLWDGRLVASGINPYVPVPADPALAPLQDTLFTLQGYPTTNTVYPPGAQLFFGSVAAMGESLHLGPIGTFRLYKLFLIAIDLVAIVVAMRLLERLGRPRRDLLLYAWHPLVLVELAGQGHTDVFWGCGIVLALGAYAHRRRHGGLPWLAAAATIRLYPLALMPLWGRFLSTTREGRRHLQRGLLISLPILLLFGVFLHDESRTRFLDVLARFTNYFEFNGGVYRLVKWLFDEAGMQPSNRMAGGVMVASLILIHGVVWLRKPGLPGLQTLLHRTLMLVTAQIALGAKAHIWYFAPALLLATMVDDPRFRRVWFWLAAIAPLTYLYYAVTPHHESVWLLAVEWGGAAVVAALAARHSVARRRGHRGGRPREGTEGGACAFGAREGTEGGAPERAEGTEGDGEGSGKPGSRKRTFRR